MEEVEQILEKDAKEEPKKAPSRRAWLLYSFGCSIFFAVEFVFLVQITEKVGPVCLFYNTSGGIIIGVGYYFYHGCLSRCIKDGKWKPQHFIVDGRLKWRNVVGIIAYCLLLITCEVFVYLTLFFSERAQINAGIIMTFWSVDPLFMALADRVFFK